VTPKLPGKLGDGFPGATSAPFKSRRHRRDPWPFSPRSPSPGAPRAIQALSNPARAGLQICVAGPRARCFTPGGVCSNEAWRPSLEHWPLPSAPFERMQVHYAIWGDEEAHPRSSSVSMRPGVGLRQAPRVGAPCTPADDQPHSPRVALPAEDDTRLYARRPIHA
jgi:hypothetical protein